jgi:hypothetical protein
MKNGRIILGIIALSVLMAGCSNGDHEAEESAAVSIAHIWLQSVDAESYEESWNEASQAFQSAIELADWQKQISNARGELGEIVSRELDTTNYKTELPGVPDGEYVVMEFRTSFANKNSAIETVTAKSEPEKGWRISGYFIN